MRFGDSASERLIVPLWYASRDAIQHQIVMFSGACRFAISTATLGFVSLKRIRALLPAQAQVILIDAIGGHFNTADRVANSYISAGASTIVVSPFQFEAMEMAMAVAHERGAMVYADLTFSRRYDGWVALDMLPEYWEPSTLKSSIVERQRLDELFKRAVVLTAKTKVDGVIIPPVCTKDEIETCSKAGAGQWEIIAVHQAMPRGTDNGMTVWPTPTDLFSAGADSVFLSCLPLLRDPADGFRQALVNV